MGKRLIKILAALSALTVATGCVIISDETDGGDSSSTGAGEDDGCNGVPVAGECIDENTIRGCIVSEQFGEKSQVITTTCKSWEKCGIGINGAECQLTTECYPGITECKDSSTMRECVAGNWMESACGADSCVTQPGQGAACISNAGGTGIKLKGHIDYEFLLPNKALNDFDPTPQKEGAVDMFVTVIDINNGKVLGMTLTSVGGSGQSPGDWEMELSAAVHDNSFIYFWPMLFDSQGFPRMAIAKAKSKDALHQKSDEYWSFGFEVCAENTGECGVTDLGNQLIRIEDGSGAVNVYQWFDFGIFRFEGLYPGVKPLTFAVFHGNDIDFSCGNCFIRPLGGGADVTYDTQGGLVDHYQSTVNISSSAKNPTMWSKSVLNHELGHWSMSSYSKSPGEGGPHFVNAASKPGLSFSEGYATFMGQTQISKSPADNDPIYFTKQQGTTFWVDISKNTFSGGPLEKPDPNGPIDQKINENVVSSMFWSFWAENNAVTPQGLKDGPVFSTMRSQRLLGSLNRGYFKVDFLDYLDALTCEKTATNAQITAVTSGVGFPWDNSPICP